MGRPLRNILPDGYYHLAQQGNLDQWVYLDEEDFNQALSLLTECSAKYSVRVHDYCLLPNHGHWLVQPSDRDGLSNMMRDMQSRYSKYLNKKYKGREWLFRTPLGTVNRPREWRQVVRDRTSLAGRVNWTQRFHATEVDLAHYRVVLRYIEKNPVRWRKCKQAADYRWSGAQARVRGECSLDLLFLDDWREESIVEKWAVELNSTPSDEKIFEAIRDATRQNKPVMIVLQKLARSQQWAQVELDLAAQVRADLARQAAEQLAKATASPPLE